MNKKGVMILLLSAIGFLVAVVLFFSTVDKLQVVGDSSFLGETEANVLDAYLEGERLLVFLETAARLSFEEEDFAYSFSVYLEKANRIFGVDMVLDDFKFEESGGFLKVICSKSFTIVNPNVRYSVTPSFVVQLSESSFLVE